MTKMYRNKTTNVLVLNTKGSGIVKIAPQGLVSMDESDAGQYKSVLDELVTSAPKVEKPKGQLLVDNAGATLEKVEEKPVNEKTLLTEKKKGKKKNRVV